jgi:flagellar L-ring protein precursor FlgH
MPMPSPQEPPAGANSLWRPGSRTFLRDQRAAAPGDLVTCWSASRTRRSCRTARSASGTGSDTLGLPRLLGPRELADAALPNAVDPSRLAADQWRAVDERHRHDSAERDGHAARRGDRFAQVLPNGNLVVAGRQQVRVNSELRDLTVSGIIRPQDIASDNTVRHDRLAEARIAYGGRGTISDVQQPRIGQQLLDIVLPF